MEGAAAAQLAAASWLHRLALVAAQTNDGGVLK